MEKPKLKSLHINVSEYGEAKGRYTGKAHFTSPLGDVGVNLSSDMSQRILSVCADSLVEASKEVALELTSSIIDHHPRLEDKGSGE